jgi:predicted DsbA family dithiol-disulfide isomerase
MSRGVPCFVWDDGTKVLGHSKINKFFV